MVSSFYLQRFLINFLLFMSKCVLILNWILGRLFFFVYLTLHTHAYLSSTSISWILLRHTSNGHLAQLQFKIFIIWLFFYFVCFLLYLFVLLWSATLEKIIKIYVCSIHIFMSSIKQSHWGLWCLDSFCKVGHSWILTILLLMSHVSFKKTFFAMIQSLIKNQRKLIIIWQANYYLIMLCWYKTN
jgi:hypothetical protein